MPSRLATSGAAISNVYAVRSYTAPSGTVYPAGSVVPPADYANVRHLDALWNKYLVIFYYPFGADELEEFLHGIYDTEPQFWKPIHLPPGERQSQLDLPPIVPPSNVVIHSPNPNTGTGILVTWDAVPGATRGYYTDMQFRDPQGDPIFGNYSGHTDETVTTNSIAYDSNSPGYISGGSGDFAVASLFSFTASTYTSFVHVGPLP